MTSAAHYRYTARDAAGELVRGSMEAPSVDAVLASLRTRALFVTAVDRETALARTVSRSLRIGGPSRRALLAFFRSFSTLVRAGAPVMEGKGGGRPEMAQAMGGLRHRLPSALEAIRQALAASLGVDPPDGTQPGDDAAGPAAATDT